MFSGSSLRALPVRRSFIGVAMFLSVVMAPPPLLAASGIQMDCDGSVKALALSGYQCSCVAGQLSCGGGPAGKSGQHPTSMKGALVGSIFGSLLISVFMDPKAAAVDPAAAAAEQQRAAMQAAQALADQQAREAEAQAAYVRMMQSYKRLEGSGGTYKTLSAATTFKRLDDSTEMAAAAARSPFDTAGGTAGSPAPPVPAGGPTPFFGDTMPMEQVRTLVNPENNPNVVDLRQAKTFIAENLKSTPPSSARAKTTDGPAKGEPIVQPPACEKLTLRLSSYLNQRTQFHKTVLMAQEQLEIWETANRNALMDAAKDGIEYFTGELLDSIAKRGEAAERLQRIYERHAAQMAKDGLNIMEIEAKIVRLRTLSSAGTVAALTHTASDWQTFLKDGTSALLNQFTASNHELQEMFQDPRMARYFQTEAPELNTLLDISKIIAAQKVFGKWAARQLPILGVTELAIKQIYNGMDWYYSYQRDAEAQKINGGVLDAAKYLQKNIDDTYIALKDCS